MIKNEKISSHQLSIDIQAKYTNKLLQILFGRYNKITNQMINLVMDFLFASPFRKNNIFVFRQGKLNINIDRNVQPLKQISIQRKQTQISSRQKSFSHHLQNSKIIIADHPTPLKQKTNYIIANNSHHNQKIYVTKIWIKPQTRTQKRILTYCGKFKEFLLGQHLAHKTIDIRFLKRQFLIPFHQLQEFQKHFNNIKQNDVNFCSFDVIDSYMALVTKNWIEIQLQSNQLSERDQKVYKVIPQDCDNPQILTGIFVRFQQTSKNWYLSGNQLNIWQEQNVWPRSQTLIRTTDGNVYLTEGNVISKTISVQFFNQ